MVFSRWQAIFTTLRKSPIVGYSILLIVSVSGVVFFNTFYSLREYEKNVDALIKSRAGLVGDLVGPFVTESWGEWDRLQNLSEILLQENSQKQGDLRNIAFLSSEREGRELIVRSSSDRENVAMTIEDARYFLALNEPGRRVVTFLDGDGRDRYWNAIKAIEDTSGKRMGVILFQFSLDKYDEYLHDTLVRVWMVAILSLSIVLLIVANHARLTTVAIRVTKLEEVDRMKDDFLSMASHELKSPLTILRGYLEMLTDGITKKGQELFAEETQYIRNMHASIDRLTTLIEDILNVSRIEQNRLPMTPQSFDITVLLSDMITECRIMADEKKLELQYEPGRSMIAFADPDRVKQILMNLLSNAIKYTEKGSVSVKVRSDGDMLRVTVADTGLGISPEHQKHLFEKFYRVKTEATMKISGTGLGLWISREIARKMGGDLVIESIEGVGSHFTLTLPFPKES